MPVLMRIAAILVGTTLALTLPLLSAEKPSAAAAAAQVPSPGEPTDPTLPVYKAPQGKTPRARVGGVTRGSLGKDPNVVALVPDHVGLTIKPKPKLHWYISQATKLPTIFTFREDEAVRPMVETPLKPPECPGIYSVQLKEFGIELKESVAYRWYISVQRDRDSPSQDIVTGGIIERIPLVEALVLFPGFTDESDPLQLAKTGLWYDALRVISDRIEAAPRDPGLRWQRAALLQQVGLSEIAELDLKPNGATCP
jgi:hypothetical protein